MATKTTSSSPFMNAKEEWLERYGSYISRAAQWRMVAFVCLGLAAVSMLGNVLQITQQKIVPYVVAVDKLGTAVAVSRADMAGEVPTRVIQAEIANAIVNWRTVTPDADLQQKMITRLSAFVVGAAKGTVKSWFEANNPYDRARSDIVSITIKGLPLPVSTNSWRIEWTEAVRNHAGVLQHSMAYEATLAISITPPTTDSQIMANPAGLLITDLSFAKLLTQ